LPNIAYKDDGKAGVTLTVTNAGSAKSVELALPASALGDLTKSGMPLTVESDVGALTLDATSLAPESFATRAEAAGDCDNLTCNFQIAPHIGIGVDFSRKAG
jgi:hypothetical protein